MAKTRKKKKRYSRCKRKTAKYQGVTVVLPCRNTKLTAKHKATIDAEYTSAAWNQCKRVAKSKKGSCRVVFFTANNPVMRRSDKKLTAGGTKASRKKRNAQCRVKRGPQKGHFRAC